MYIRCVECKTSTRVPIESRGDSVTCVACGRTFGLERASELGRTPSDRYKVALELSREKGIDLASAYSILLGIMSIDEALEFQRSFDQIQEEQAGGPAAARRPKMPSYDRDFKDAVAAGHLTIRQAVERGDRVAYASRLAERHKLPMMIAFDVTDNRINLRDALEKTRLAGKAKAAQDSLGPESEASAFSWIAATLLVAAAAFVFGAWGPWSNRPTAATGPGSAQVSTGDASKPAAPSVQPVTTIRTDADGQLTQLIGPSPGWILNAYCTADPSAPSREPIKVTSSGDVWLGVFRDADGLRTIEIRKDERTQSWVVGDGFAPIPTSAG